VFARREPIALLAVASIIRKHEVVAKVGRIPGPRDEVVHMRHPLGDTLAAVKASAALDVHQDRPYHFETVPLAAEQELVQVGRLAEDIKILLTHVPEPCAPDLVSNERMELAEAESDARLQLNRVAYTGVLLQEVYPRLPDRLEFP
jgi:hypothetical protein